MPALPAHCCNTTEPLTVSQPVLFRTPCPVSLSCSKIQKQADGRPMCCPFAVWSFVGPQIWGGSGPALAEGLATQSGDTGQFTTSSTAQRFALGLCNPWPNAANKPPQCGRLCDRWCFDTSVGEAPPAVHLSRRLAEGVRFFHVFSSFRNSHPWKSKHSQSLTEALSASQSRNSHLQNLQPTSSQLPLRCIALHYNYTNH